MKILRRRCARQLAPPTGQPRECRYVQKIGLVIRHEPRNHRNPEARTNIKGRQRVLNIAMFFFIIPSRGNSQWKKTLWPEEQLSSRHCWRWFGGGTRGLPVTRQRSDGVQDHQPIIYGTRYELNTSWGTGMQQALLMLTGLGIWLFYVWYLSQAGSLSSMAMSGS